MRPIMHTEKGICYRCGAYGQTHEHHIFDGPNRKNSERYGLKVYLCIPCHVTARDAVHNDIKEMRKLQIDGQKEFEKKKSREEFMKIFGRNYIMEE